MDDDVVSQRMSADIYDQQHFRVDFQGNVKIEKIVEFVDKKVFIQSYILVEHLRKSSFSELLHFTCMELA